MLSARGIKFITLNVVRFLSILAIVLVFASNIVIMVNDVQAFNANLAQGSSSNTNTINSTDINTVNSTDVNTVNCDYITGSTIPNQTGGEIWSVINRLLILFQVIVLFLSEIGWPAAFFSRFFPILGQEFGLGALGIIQALIGAAVLSHRVEDFALVSAFFLFSVGCINMFLGLLFREKAKGLRAISAWNDRNEDILSPPGSVLPIHRTGSSAYPVSFKEYGLRHSQSDDDHESPKSTGYGFGRQGEKAAGLKGFMISQPVQSLPKYAPSGSR